MEEYSSLSEIAERIISFKKKVTAAMSGVVNLVIEPELRPVRWATPTSEMTLIRKRRGPPRSSSSGAMERASGTSRAGPNFEIREAQPDPAKGDPQQGFDAHAFFLSAFGAGTVSNDVFCHSAKSS